MAQDLSINGSVVRRGRLVSRAKSIARNIKRDLRWWEKQNEQDWKRAVWLLQEAEKVLRKLSEED